MAFMWGEKWKRVRHYFRFEKGNFSMNAIFHLSKLSALFQDFHVKQSEKLICFGAVWHVKL